MAELIKDYLDAYKDDPEFLREQIVIWEGEVTTLKADLAEAIELLKESYSGRPPNGRVFLQAIVEHHERIRAFLEKHKALEVEKGKGCDG